jgi:hypothetical protein
LGILGIVWIEIQVALQADLLPLAHHDHPKIRPIANNGDLPVWRRRVVYGPTGLCAGTSAGSLRRHDHAIFNIGLQQRPGRSVARPDASEE